MAERDRQRANGVCVVHEAVKFRPLGARLLHAITDYDEAAGKDFQWSRDRPTFSARLFTSAKNSRPAARLDCAVNTASAVSAASWRPASEAPAWTMTGQPWIGRAMLSGPRTDRYFPLWLSTCSLSGSKKSPFRTPRTKPSSAQLPHRPVTTS